MQTHTNTKQEDLWVEIGSQSQLLYFYIQSASVNWLTIDRSYSSDRISFEIVQGFISTLKVKNAVKTV